MWSSSVVGSKSRAWEKTKSGLAASLPVLVLDISLQLQLLFLLNYINKKNGCGSSPSYCWSIDCHHVCHAWQHDQERPFWFYSSLYFLPHHCYFTLPSCSSLLQLPFLLFHPITHLGIGIPSSLFASFCHYEICSFQDQILEPFLHPKLWSFFSSFSFLANLSAMFSYCCLNFFALILFHDKVETHFWRPFLLLSHADLLFFFLSQGEWFWDPVSPR